MAETTRPATMREAFRETLQYLRPSYGHLYEMYWMYLTPVAYRDKILVVSAPDDRRREVCQLRHAALLSRSLRLVTGLDVQIEFVVATDQTEGGAPC